ncbi:uncharacterized protein [Panulirus ornatus]|uniref:uncharacterized protein n=1 Tax=Panulirus ornatus TaxID=150431 RepID=UPI003A8A4A2D
MSTDPAAFVAGVPVKISERFRPPRRVTIPASCQHHINPDLLTQEYDFVVEKTALKWVQERRALREREERERKERIAEYDRKKAERIAKEEERLRKEKEEEERQAVLREEEEKKKQEEKRQLDEEKRKEDEQKQEVGDEIEDESAEESTNKQTADADGTETLERKTSTSSQENVKTDSQQLHPNTQESVTVTPKPRSENRYIIGNTIHNTDTTYRTETGAAYDWMLKPTPIPSQKNSLKSPSKTPASINFADFEGEANDPFDSAALKSINDMEELAKVLDSSNIRQQPQEGSNVIKQNSSEEGRSHSNTYTNGQISYNAYGQYPFFMQQQQQNMSQPGQSFSQYANHMGKSSQVTSTSCTVPSYTNSSQYGGDPSRTFQNTFYPQQWNNGFNTSSPSKAAQFVPYDYRLHAGNIPNSVASTTQGVMSPGSTSGSTATMSVTTTSGFPTMPSAERGTTPGKRPDLEDFYSKYYSQSKTILQPSQQSGIQSGESTPSHSSSSGAAGSTNGSLRSCRSVPDLTAAEDSEVTKYSSGIQSHSDSLAGFHSLPPRPSSTGLSGLEDWKPLPDLSEPPETLSDQHLYQSGPPQHPSYTSLKSRLPDPFAELTTDAQALVQSMAEMGFPRPRVARAVQKLGTDHKKLIEVLLVLQSLQENGEDGYKAERAFYHYMGDVQKTRDHIAAAKQLLDLGFEEERIVDALLKHDNDRDKALEELIA